MPASLIRGLGQIARFVAGTSGDPYITFDGGTAQAEIGTNRNSNGFVGMLSSSSFTIRTNNTDRMFFDAGGNVGIGTTSPNSKLEVSGGAGTGGVRVVGTDANFNAGSTAALMDYDTTTNIARFGQIKGVASTLGSLVLLTSNAERLRIDSSGNVGISSSAPTGLFTVGNGTMVVTAAGNVGIGTTDPASKLEVGNINNGGVFKIFADTANEGQIVISRASGSVVPKIKFLDPYFPANNMYFGQDGAAALKFFDGSLNPLMTIQTNGNVGIGTTSPYTRLHVVGAEAVAGTVAKFERGGAEKNFYIRPLGNERVQLDSAGAFTFGTNANDTTSGNEVFRINANGNVGVGTTNPSEKLDVSGQVMANGFKTWEWTGTLSGIGTKEDIYFDGMSDFSNRPVLVTVGLNGNSIEDFRVYLVVPTAVNLTPLVVQLASNDWSGPNGDSWITSFTQHPTYPYLRIQFHWSSTVAGDHWLTARVMRL